MKRIYTLIVLLGLVMGAALALTGCGDSGTNPPPASTNAPASTNK